MKFERVTTQMKAIELHFLVVLFILLYKVILTFESVHEIRKRGHSNKSHWAVVFLWFILLYKVILSFESVDEIRKNHHSNESYWVVLSCSAIYIAVTLGGSELLSLNYKVWLFNWKLLSCISCSAVCFSGFYKSGIFPVLNLWCYWKDTQILKGF